MKPISPTPEAIPRPPPVPAADMRRPRCGSNRPPKDGASKGRQVYHCGDCGRRSIPEASYQRPSAAAKERGAVIHKEGSSLSAETRVFGVSVQAVSRWAKREDRRAVQDAAAGAASCHRRRRPAAAIAGDEMWICRQARRKDKRQSP